MTDQRTEQPPVRDMGEADEMGNRICDQCGQQVPRLHRCALEPPPVPAPAPCVQLPELRTYEEAEMLTDWPAGFMHGQSDYLDRLVPVLDAARATDAATIRELREQLDAYSKMAGLQSLLAIDRQNTELRAELSALRDERDSLKARNEELETDAMTDDYARRLEAKLAAADAALVSLREEQTSQKLRLAVLTSWLEVDMDADLIEAVTRSIDRARSSAVRAALTQTGGETK